MPSSSQFKIDSSNGSMPFVSTIPYAVTAPFAPTALFGILANSQLENAHHLHPASAHHQDQPPPTMSPMTHRVPKSAGGTTSGSALSPTAGMPTRVGHLAATGHTRAKGVQGAPNELSGAHTPLRHAQFERELTGHPDKAWVSKLLTAIKIGVRIGHTGPRHYTHARNLSSAFQHPEVIDQELAKECDAGRILGPFTTSPIYPLQCSGLGAIPKKNGKWRMIMHLSAPAGRSVNDGIHPEEFSLHYSSVDDAVAILLHLGKGALMAKIDLKSAFRMIPVHYADWDLLGIHWRGQYYVDTCLPFGLRSAPFLFNEYATAIEWIMTHNYQLCHLIHYLDDFFLAAPPQSSSCQRDLDTFLQVASKLGVPVATEKVEGPITAMSFLGLILDSVKQEIRLPPDKLAELTHELDRWSTRRKATKRELLSLIGKLSFAARAVPAGRLFLRRLISLASTVAHLHHRIRLNAEARADITWWRTFLPTWNGTAKFIDPNSVQVTDMLLYTDASGSDGCGAYYQGAWFFYAWRPHQHLQSIQWKELFAIVAATLTWGHQWQGKRVKFMCDNQAIVLAWQGQRSRDSHIMKLMRTLFMFAAQHNFTITMQHIPGNTNVLADAISRRQLTKFLSLAPQAQRQPTQIPGMLDTL